MSEPKAEIIHVHAMRLDDLGLAEDTASRALAFLRKGQNVEIRFAARTMLKGFAERMLGKLLSGEDWPGRALVKFVGDPDLLVTLARAREDNPEFARAVQRAAFGVGADGPSERTPKPKPPKGGA
jgi:hypothetical protein